MRTLPHTRSCFVCGEANVAGCQLKLETDDERVQLIYRAREDHIGFLNTLHGGITSTLLDEAMAWLCAVHSGHFAYCAELTVRFQSPIRTGAEVTIVAEMETNRNGRLFLTRAEARTTDGALAAKATGKYLPIRETEAADLAVDFVGDPASVCRRCSAGSG